MKIINANVEELIQKPGWLGMLQQIERGGRVCYKSEDKITEDSALKFVSNLIKRGHYAPLEHGTIYLKIPFNANATAMCLINFFEKNRFSYTETIGDYAYITTNYRVVIENEIEEDIEPYICEKPLKYHRLRKTFLITCDRGISHELVRHRVMSFNQESTRYINYSKDKWGNEITVIKPCFWNEDDESYLIWKTACEEAEKNYMKLIESGARPEEARSVLPNSTKTEILMTGFMPAGDELGWDHFISLRYNKAAHPQAREIASKIKAFIYPEEKELEKELSL